MLGYSNKLFPRNPSVATGNEIARGAEGVLTREDFLGMRAVVKDRVRKGYREPHLDEKLRAVRTRNEAKLLHEAKKAGVNCPVVYSVSGSELIVSFIDGELLRSMLRRKAAGVEKQLKLTGGELGKLHSVDVVHGDFTTANVMVAKGIPWIIDFGLGGFAKDLEEKAVDVLLMKRSLTSSEYKEFLKGYSPYKEAKKVLGRLEEIEQRGRYVVRRMAEEGED